MPRAKILIVEDECLVASHLESIIEDRGYMSVGIAPDLGAALELAEAKPDLALVDVNLCDGPTGPLIAERLAEHGVGILFVTANPRMLEGAAGAAIGVLTKPCDEEVIGAAVDYALNARQGAALPAPPTGLRLFSAAS